MGSIYYYDADIPNGNRKIQKQRVNRGGGRSSEREIEREGEEERGR